MDDAASTLSDAAAQIDFSLLSGANATFIAEMNGRGGPIQNLLTKIGMLIFKLLVICSGW